MSTPLRDHHEIIREEPLMHLPILEALADGPLTVPEIAERIGCPKDEVLVWVMGMRRFGKLVEVDGEDDEGFFRYADVREGAS